MKKIFTACCTIIAIALMITVFNACGKDKTDNESKNESVLQTSAPGVSANVGDTVFAARVKEDCIEILNADKVYQTLKFQQDSSQPFDREYAAEHFEFIDMNFDGQPDFYVATANDGEFTYYYCWLYNATTKQFDYSVSLSALKNITVDSENQRILTTSEKDGKTLIVSYRWINGELSYDTDYATEKVSDTITENILGTGKPKQDADYSKSENKSSSVSVTENPKTTKKESEKTNAEKTTLNNVGDSVRETVQTTTQTTQKKPMNTTTTAPAVGNNVVLNTDSDIDENWF